jgi:hypothetical protein
MVMNEYMLNYVPYGFASQLASLSVWNSTYKTKTVNLESLKAILTNLQIIASYLYNLNPTKNSLITKNRIAKILGKELCIVRTVLEKSV